jgi:hypothetical protein
MGKISLEKLMVVVILAPALFTTVVVLTQPTNTATSSTIEVMSIPIFF